MYVLLEEETQTHKFVRCRISSDGNELTFLEFLDLLVADEVFRRWFSQTLAESSFDAFRWETPALSTDSVNSPFEFVLVNSPGFSKRKTDPVTFRKKFNAAQEGSVITFANLRGDATMVVPTPKGEIECYGHLASFLRRAPSSQIDKLWQIVGETTKRMISNVPVWLSTAGGGVAWLHVRFDSSPKYYNYGPYRQITE